MIWIYIVRSENAIWTKIQMTLWSSLLSRPLTNMLDTILFCSKIIYLRAEHLHTYIGKKEIKMSWEDGCGFQLCSKTFPLSWISSKTTVNQSSGTLEGLSWVSRGSCTAVYFWHRTTEPALQWPQTCCCSCRCHCASMGFLYLLCNLRCSKIILCFLSFREP